MELFKLLGTIAIENDSANNALDDTVQKARKTDDALNEADDSSRKLSSGGFTVLKGAAANLAANGLMKVASSLGQIVTGAVGYQNQMEQYTTSFATMTGSAEKAAEVTERLQSLGAATPFEMTDLADTTQLLMNYGFEADNAVDKMTMLGDISQGNADKMNRIAMAYGQMSSAGKVSLEDVKQMIEAGFNPLQEISESTGESMESLYDRISKGTISVDEITASMERSTSEGGKYFGAMDAQSQTLEGRLSTLKDTVNASLGTALSGVLNSIATSILPKVTNAISAIPWEMVSSFLGMIFDTLSQLIDPMMEIGGAILPVVVKLVQTILPPIMQLVQSIMPPLMTLIEGIMQILSPIIDLLTPLLDAIMAILSPLLDLINVILQPLIDLFKGVANVLSTVLGPVFEGIGAVCSKIGEGFSWLKGKASEAFSGMKSSIEKHGGGIKGIIGATGEQMKKSWDMACGALDKITGGKFSGMVDSVKEKMGNMKASIEEHGGGIKGFFGAAGDAIKNNWTNAFNKMNEATGGKLGNMLNSVKEKVGSIKENMSAKLTQAKDTVVGIFDKIKTGITDKINLAKNTISGIIEKIKGFFKFKFELPKIKLPHFGITPKGWKIGDLMKGSIPKLGIQWYAKGGVMEEPTAFGMNGNNVMVGGEAGAEAIAPIETLQKYIAEAVSVNDNRVASLINANFERLLEFLQQYIPQMANMQMVLDSGAVVGALAPEMDYALGKLAIRNGRGV